MLCRRFLAWSVWSITRSRRVGLQVSGPLQHAAADCAISPVGWWAAAEFEVFIC
jgi:hypothetical protein